MKKLLHLKHWQLFLLSVGLPVIGEFILMGLAVGASNLDIFFVIMPIIMIISLFTLYGWLWAMGTALHSMLPPGVDMNLRKFKIYFFVPLFFVAIVILLLVGIGLTGSPTEEMNTTLPVIMVPVAIFVMYCMFYCLYFIAKELKAVEYQRAVNFGDCAGDFLLIWFYPIGVWAIQPRINKLFSDTPADFLK